ncbi:unnamed protein product [Penicillium discolor]
MVGWDDVFSFQDYGELVALLSNSIIAGAVLGLVGGLIGVFVMQRDLAFAVHGPPPLAGVAAHRALRRHVRARHARTGNPRAPQPHAVPRGAAGRDAGARDRLRARRGRAGAHPARRPAHDRRQPCAVDRRDDAARDRRGDLLQRRRLLRAVVRVDLLLGCARGVPPGRPARRHQDARADAHDLHHPHARGHHRCRAGIGLRDRDRGERPCLSSPPAPAPSPPGGWESAWHPSSRSSPSASR